MARESKKVITRVSRDEAENAMAKLAEANSRLKIIEAKIELEKQRIDEKFKSEVSRLVEEKDANMEVLEVWAKKEAPTWDGKSYELTHGTLGFRTGTPKLEKNKKFTWTGITALLAEHFPNLVRTKQEPDKEAIIALRDTPEFEAVSKKCYVEVVQDETFFVNPKEEELVS